MEVRDRLALDDAVTADVMIARRKARDLDDRPETLQRTGHAGSALADVHDDVRPLAHAPGERT